ncbi:MAG: IMPACT family protein [Acidobacteriota bacterium]
MSTPRPHHTWLAPARPAREEISVRGSRFLGDLLSVEDQEEASLHLERLRQEFPHASHHCWATRIFTGPRLENRSSDAGEPAGTAGLPLLRALESAGVEGVSLVVVRWFGGIKLGAGPLGRAYRETAARTLKAAGVEARCFYRLLAIRFPYTDSSSVRRAIFRLGGVVRTEQPGDRAGLLIQIPEEQAAAMAAALRDATRGRIEVEETGRLAAKAIS